MFVQASGDTSRIGAAGRDGNRPWANVQDCEAAETHAVEEIMKQTRRMGLPLSALSVVLILANTTAWKEELK